MTAREIAYEFIIAADWFDVTREESRLLVEAIQDWLGTLEIRMIGDTEIVSQCTTLCQNNDPRSRPAPACGLTAAGCV